MGSQTVQPEFLDGALQDVSVRALVYELQQPLIAIARLSELEDSESRAAIGKLAEQNLRLIDSYLLTQVAHDQLTLDLSPANIGAVLYDAAQELRESVVLHDAELLVHDQTHEPVMTNRPALTAAVCMFAQAMLGSSRAQELVDGEDSDHHQEQLLLKGYRTRSGGLGIGVFSRSSISAADITLALQLQGKAQMPMARVHHGAHVSLVIAHSLCSAIGGKMQVKQMGAWSGLATELPRSEQMTLLAG